MKKKYILITGATSGIGRFLAKNLTEKYNIILHGRNKKKLKKISEKYPGSIVWNQDLEKLNDIENSFSNIQKKVKIYGFIHSAGFFLPEQVRDLENFSIIKTFSINVLSAIIILKLLLKIENKKFLKRVIFISSNISNNGAKAMSLYGSSKSALDGFMRSASIEMGKKININSILPGATKTNMTSSIFKNHELLKKMISCYPAGLIKTRNLAEVVSFLLSSKSSAINGQQIYLDGGRSFNISI